MTLQFGRLGDAYGSVRLPGAPHLRKCSRAREHVRCAHGLAIERASACAPIWRRCRQRSRAAMETSTPSASVAESSAASTSTTMSAMRALRAGTNGACRHGRRTELAGEGVRRRGATGVSHSEDCSTSRLDQCVSSYVMNATMTQLSIDNIVCTVVYVTISRQPACALRAHASHPVRPRGHHSRERTAVVGLRPSTVLEDCMSKQKGELMSVKIIPNEQASPAGKLADAEVVFEAEAGPLQRIEADRLRRVGTSRWREERDVSGPAVLRERGTPELCVAASRQW